MEPMSMKSLNWTLLIFGATMWSLFVALAGAGRLSSSNLLILAALCLTPAGIGLTLGGARQSPLVCGIDRDLTRPWGAMLSSRGRGRRRS
jgi:hypothetical protein